MSRPPVHLNYRKLEIPYFSLRLSKQYFYGSPYILNNILISTCWRQQHEFLSSGRAGTTKKGLQFSKALCFMPISGYFFLKSSKISLCVFFKICFLCSMHSLGPRRFRFTSLLFPVGRELPGLAQNSKASVHSLR